MKWLNFILSHSIFISICAFALCMQSFQLLHIAANYTIPTLVFFATLGSYNFYWLISKYYFAPKTGLLTFLRQNAMNVVFLLLASVGILFCLFTERHLLPEILVSAGLTLLYSVPLWPGSRPAYFKKAGFVKTVLLAFTWTYVTVVIPAGEGIWIHTTPALLLFTARFLFMLMLCIIFDSRDAAVDKMRSLHSLATAVTKKTLGIIMALVFACYVATGVVLRYFFDDRPQLVAFLLTGIIVLLVYRLSLKKQGYVFYYFWVDGLMLISALATYIAAAF
ncbi:MAG: hypothetical protein JST02_13210 [Bacteroidetes bacterium]|nr:hypothetical protein [Bacteroidota bacterium]